MLILVEAIRRGETRTERGARAAARPAPGYPIRKCLRQAAYGTRVGHPRDVWDRPGDRDWGRPPYGPVAVTRPADPTHPVRAATTTNRRHKENCKPQTESVGRTHTEPNSTDNGAATTQRRLGKFTVEHEWSQKENSKPQNGTVRTSSKCKEEKGQDENQDRRAIKLGRETNTNGGQMETGKPQERTRFQTGGL